MKILGKVIKSQSDNRLYKAVRLPNQIDCLLISDKDACKSSAALSVGVGSLIDPMEAQGLAHYLQHMLFMGTKKYPDENDYSNFITKNSGSSNAYTSQDLTNYHFEVSSNAFEGALDRFAQFFISPLMSDSSSKRELNAVHSEHVKNLQNDNWRKFQLSKHLAKDGHPFKKFSTGNMSSLSHPNLREMLHKFYSAHYSSNLMKLVVFSNQDPEELSQLVAQKFTAVPNNNYPQLSLDSPPYSPSAMKKVYKISPIKAINKLEISWQLPFQGKHYQSHPAKYLSHLFGHQGKGSLLSVLIEKGLAYQLSSHFQDNFDCFTDFSVGISLTQKGVKEYKTVLGHTLCYLDMLRNQSPAQWIFEEIKKVSEMKFNFLEKRQGIFFTSGLAHSLQKRQAEEVMAFPYFMKQWNPEAIQELVSHMKNQKMMIFLESKQVEDQCNLIEPIYQTQYCVEDLTDVDLEPIPCNVSFPEKNPFVAEDFEVLPMGDSALPEQLPKNSSNPQIMQTYYKQDHLFRLPKSCLKLRLYFDGALNIKQSLSMAIYSEMLRLQMRQFAYLGDMAQIHSDFSFNTSFCADITVIGFRDSVEKYTQPFIRKVFDFEPCNAELFEIVKQQIRNRYVSYFWGDPFRMAYTTLNLALKEGFDFPTATKLAELDHISLEDVSNFSKSWKKKLRMESLITGNLMRQSAQKMSDQIKEFVSIRTSLLPETAMGEIRSIKLPPLKNFIIETQIKSPKQENSSLIVHFQHQAYSRQLRARQKMLQSLCYSFIKQPAFDYLRTKQQLGYIVMCLPDESRGILGMSILIQSAIKTSQDLIYYVDQFTDHILKHKLGQLSEQLFEEYKKSLVNSKMENDKNLGEETSRFWAEITKHSYEFNSKQKEIEQLQSITLSEFHSFVQSLFYVNPKRLEIHMISQKNQERNNELRKHRVVSNPNLKIFKDVEQFRKTVELYPDFYAKL